MQIEQALIAARSPWQNPYVERVIGSICRECLDPVNVLNARHLRRILPTMLPTITASRAHLAPAKDPSAIEPPDRGEIIAIPEVGGLHHRYSRGAA